MRLGKRYWLPIGIVACSSWASLSCAAAGNGNGNGGTSEGSSAGSSSGGQAAGGRGDAPGPNINLGGLPAEGKAGPCAGLECQVPMCSGAVTTSISGKVFDPAGKVPLYNVVVYVPNGPVPAFSEGASCDRCGSSIKNPVTSAVTDETGAFVLSGAPAGADIPLVIQVGKWRRQIRIPAVSACVENKLSDPQLTRLPRNKTEGDLPRIAISAGGSDQMECLPRLLGIDDAEFTPAGGSGRIHLYSGGGDENTIPITRFAETLNGGAMLTPATDLWSTSASLLEYDIVLLSCEGGSRAEQKPMSARQALYDYASMGGRVFASHLHNIWFAEGPAPLPATGTWSERQDPAADGLSITANVNQAFPKGAALAKWLVNVGASTTIGEMNVAYPRDNLQAVNPQIAREWITLQNPLYPAAPHSVQYMSFSTPIGVPEEQACGRAVYTNLHVSAIDNVGKGAPPPFPTACPQRDLSAQEKAVAFMLFDLSACIQNDDEPPKPPR